MTNNILCSPKYLHEFYFYDFTISWLCSLINTGSGPQFEKLGFVSLKSSSHLCLSFLLFLLLLLSLSVSCLHLPSSPHPHSQWDTSRATVYHHLHHHHDHNQHHRSSLPSYCSFVLTRAGFLKSILATERIYTVPVFLLLMDLRCVHFSSSSFTDSLCWFECVEVARRLFFSFSFWWGGCEMFLQLSHLLFILLLLSSQRQYGAALWWKLHSATALALRVLLSCWVYLSLQSLHI